MAVIEEDIMSPVRGVMQVSRATVDLLNEIWKKIGADKKANSLIAGTVNMTRRALNASAAALFFVNEDKQELVLRFAAGGISRQVKHYKIDSASGLTGWVTRTGKAVLMNTVASNPRVNRFATAVYGFATQSLICVPVTVHRRTVAVIEVANKAGQPNFSKVDLRSLAGIAATVALVIENVRLNDCLRGYYKSTINALVSLADAKETTNRGHSRRVAEYALMGARRLKLNGDYRHSIEYAAILHDVGKLAIPDRILNKPGVLDDGERQIMNGHAEIGHNLIREIPFLEDASWLVLYHHERYDGSGYPRQLKGREIPIGARLIAVADAFDNMTTEHAYRGAMSVKEALIEINRHIRSQFCPVAVKALFSGLIAPD